jgi:hypothetical protein
MSHPQWEGGCLIRSGRADVPSAAGGRISHPQREGGCPIRSGRADVPIRSGWRDIQLPAVEVCDLLEQVCSQGDYICSRFIRQFTPMDSTI